MANNLVREIILSRLRAAIAEARGVSDINHNYLKGKIREILLDNFLSPYLTVGLCSGSGKIMDYVGNQSLEVDIVIYSKNILPSIMFDIKTGVFPIESCFQVIEVKSKTSSSEIQDSIRKAESIKQLRFLTGDFSPKAEPYYASGRQIHRVLFAFDSDLKEKEELNRYAELDPNFKTDPAITSICVVGKCYHYFDYDKRKWAILEPPSEKFYQEYFEVLYFISVLLNSLPNHVKDRRTPPFGAYLCESNEGIPVIET